jgi:hypothetical protein
MGRLALALSEDFHAYEVTEANLALPVMAAAGGGLNSSAIPDPTLAVILSHERYFEACGMVTEAAGLLIMLRRQMVDVVKENRATHEKVAAAIRAARCSGEVDPLCADNAVRGGLCWRCLGMLRRYGLDEARQRVTAR